MSALTVVDIYSGVGGMSLGAARAGFKLVGAIDHDPIPLEAHRINFPLVTHLERDAAESSGADILRACGVDSVDGVIGGPPCQGFSFMGKRNPNDKRNDLFVQFYRLVSEIEPKFFVCENVPGILQKRYEGLRKRAEEELGSRYTILKPLVVDASEYGAPTARTRVFFIGFRNHSGLKLAKADFDTPKYLRRVTVKKALKGLPKKVPNGKFGRDEGWMKKTSSGSRAYFDRRVRGHIPAGVGDAASIALLHRKLVVSGFAETVHSKEVVRRMKRLGSGEVDIVSKAVRLSQSGYCPTLRAGTGKDKGSYQSLRPIHPTEHRVITPREAARLQGFPDWFQFHPSKWHSFRQIGNSVSPLVAEYLLGKIRIGLDQL